MALRVNATGKRLERTTNLPARPLTITFWMKRIQDDGQSKHIGSFLGGATSDNYLAIAGSFDVDFYVREDVAGADEEYAATLSNMTNNVWYFCATAWNSGNNPTQASSLTQVGSSFVWDTDTSTIGNLPAAEVFNLGGVSATSAMSGYLNGRILALKVWTAKLTTAEMEAEQFYYDPQRTSNVHVWHPLQTESTDHSANGFNFSEIGAIAWEADEPAGMNALGGGRRWILGSH